VNALRWLGAPVTEAGITERRFDLLRSGTVVPGILWQPEHPQRTLPLVLLGHGGSGHKRADRQLQLARRFAESQIAAVAIDGPYHGDRLTEPLDSRQYQQQMAATGVDTVTDSMVDDWFAVLDAIGSQNLIDTNRVAYLGLSMGTRFGLPFVAAAGPRLRCAVLGKYGLQQPQSMPAAIDMTPRFTRDAPRITVPLLFHVQRDDELFPRPGQLNLFDLLGSPDKQLLTFPGPHGHTPPTAITTWHEFVCRRLEL
jgi:dienelactone hydrolase